MMKIAMHDWPPLFARQQAIGLFALAGVSGACVAPFVGRIADAGHRQLRIARAAQLVALTTAVIPSSYRFLVSAFGLWDCWLARASFWTQP
ncbi:hypothetical protein FJ414_17605 [Mesorhizobium sp. B3-1-6]|uniref:hypothetical protein n=1 Tax=Mesorhizobium sp. B3-1-6 TaxID=2589895 RepID=UPI001129818A|nr:hypothetical protein [Mesorhizobium sp. B3-1-6]TPI35864.1 hypothetical protein FJ414_17605 [Mesorhizobium sp. B3-1-6]